MNNTPTQYGDVVPRTQWVRALLRVPAEQVIALADTLVEQFKLTHVAIPRNGLMLMRMQESVFSEDYYLGELPVSSAWIALTDREGQQVQGAAQIMDDREELAVAMAVCDAVLSNRLQGWRAVAELVDQGAELIAEERHIRKAMLARTRVDFSLVSEDAEE